MSAAEQVDAAPSARFAFSVVSMNVLTMLDGRRERKSSNDGLLVPGKATLLAIECKAHGASFVGVQEARTRGPAITELESFWRVCGGSSNGQGGCE
eukprot:8752710-Alexandrium_andersonii.AAC.1